jgi:DtxR family transcriptional regulator, Mn-dependent transcriptional regulator
MPTSTVEDYLKYIYMIEREKGGGGPVSTGRIAAALDVSPGTATAMVKTLADTGLVSYEPYTGVTLTPAGAQLATHVLRRHRVVELFLVKVMGMDWSDVHDDAERLEHAVSDRVIERMDEMLGRPSVDPHGDPIPSPRGVVREPHYADLLACPLGSELQVARITDQATPFLRMLERHGVVPGNRLAVEAREEAADTVVVRAAGHPALGLGFRAASKILVAQL